VADAAGPAAVPSLSGLAIIVTGAASRIGAAGGRLCLQSGPAVLAVDGGEQVAELREIHGLSEPHITDAALRALARRDGRGRADAARLGRLRPGTREGGV
jgi:hypothetical protein